MFSTLLCLALTPACAFEGDFEDDLVVGEGEDDECPGGGIADPEGNCPGENVDEEDDCPGGGTPDSEGNCPGENENEEDDCPGGGMPDSEGNCPGDNED